VADNFFIDTHCHLDFLHDVDVQVSSALAANVRYIIIPAVNPHNWHKVIDLAYRYNCGYCLGIHPFYANQVGCDDIANLQKLLSSKKDDPHLLAVGEIGLDFWIENHNLKQQQWLLHEQIKLATEFALPIIVHARKAVETVFVLVKKYQSVGLTGIIHAFNGSLQQAANFIDLGFKLGFCGAVTYQRARKLRYLASKLPLTSIVLETDAPDMHPAWISDRKTVQNSPMQIPAIAEVIADLRGIDIFTFTKIVNANTCQILPKLRLI